MVLHTRPLGASADFRQAHKAKSPRQSSAFHPHAFQVQHDKSGLPYAEDRLQRENQMHPESTDPSDRAQILGSPQNMSMKENRTAHVVQQGHHGISLEGLHVYY